MTIQTILQKLVENGIISGRQTTLIADYELKKPFSIHWELRSVLYIGILLFSAGTGIIIYENIDTIGHQAIIAIIATLTVACFFYVSKHSLPYSHDEVKSPVKLADFVLLLGCTTFLALEGYLQFQYNVFGTRYGLAIIIPTIVFFFCAYRFDHKGALSMAITGLASWLGLTIAPMSIFENDFTEGRLLVTAVILGSMLVGFGWVSEVKKVKKHFAFTYMFLGGNLSCIASLIGLFSQDLKIVYFVIGLGLTCFFVLRARHQQSLIFLLMGVIYGYIIITYSLFTLLGDEAAFLLSSVYFMASSVGVIIFLLKFKKFLGIKNEKSI
ncbi:DUF2157 domain-containing protein [Dyadobacter sp. CY323]|uniref:DUF2157 domain-containing protein n=1 Tax=Dyadobacter sp. CY323 TaxID=2907302 RepID=UPI001F278780|nr:DUF2157 domain-containing protein [Dyadobacter sp. CY323]MCE6987664.1 DUF2157 domain-containing protein [Dyadobacter sp. CY323]